MEYNGIVVKYKESFLLFFEKSKGVFSNGIPISDSEKIYENLKDYQVNFCKVQFCDGTEAKSFEIIDTIEEVFFKIKDLAIVAVCDKEQNPVNAIEALENDGYNLLSSFFNESIFNS